jgi:hypothetical protein
MIDPSAFVSNPGASPWITTSPAPKLIRHEVQKAKKQQLLTEAQSLVPDSGKLTDILDKSELGPADKIIVGDKLNSTYSGYVEKYNENPYYAFSKEGKDRVREMQRIVSDPKNTLYSQLYKAATEERKRVQNNLGFVNYDKGSVKMINKSTGKIEDVALGQINFTEYSPLTTGEEFNYRANVAGFANNPTEFKVNQEDYSKVIDKIDKFLSNTGDYKYQQIFEGQPLSKISSSNFTQIKSKADLIKSAAGLSESEYNAILAQYYTPRILAGEKVTEQEGQKYLLDLVDSIKSGHMKAEERFIENPLIDANRKTAEALEKNVVNLGVGLGATAKVYGTRNINYSYTGQDRDTVIQANNLHNEVLAQTTGQQYTVKTAGGEDKYPKVNMGTLLVSRAAEKDNAMIIDQTTGKPVVEPILAKHQDQVVPSYIGQVMVPYKIDETGTKTYLPLSEKGGPGVEQEMMLLVEGEIGAINYRGPLDYMYQKMGWGFETDREILTMAEKYKFGEPSVYEKETENYMKYMNNANVSADRADKMGKGAFAMNDDLNVYRVTYLLPLQGTNPTDKARNIDKALGVETLVGRSHQRVDEPANYNFNKTNSPGKYPTANDL